jgi:hypothetical protein
VRWLVLVVVAGCYSPSPYTSCLVTCAANLDCPTGQACFAGRCSERAGQCTTDAALDAPLDPKGDIDNDGIANGDDKCPTLSSPDNHDHDGDGTGDPCDPCPHLKGPDLDLDADGDMVGDGCDRNPMVPGEQRLAFYGFYDPAEIVSWARQGNYTINATTHRLVADNQANGNAFIELPGTFLQQLHLATFVRITAPVEDTPDDKYVGISTHRNASGFYQGCQLRRSVSTSGVRHRVYNATLDDASVGYVGTFVDSHRLQMIQHAETRCDVDGQFIQRATQPSVGGVGLDASLVQAEFDYLFIVQLP